MALRSLNRIGLRVGVADTRRLGMSQASRFKTCVFTYAPPLQQPEAFVKDVATLLERTGAHFILPGHDETEILARFRSRLPAGVILPVAPVEKLELTNNKACMIEYVDRIGLPVPDLVGWHTLPELERLLRNTTNPKVVKLRRGNSAKGVFYPRSAAETIRMCEELIERYQLSPERYPIVQERVAGEGWGVSCLYWHGDRLASFTHRRLREKTASGSTSTLRESQNQPYPGKDCASFVGRSGLARAGDG